MGLFGGRDLIIAPRSITLKGFGRKNRIKLLAQGDQHSDDPGHIPEAANVFLKAVHDAPEGSGAFLLGDPFTFANTRSQKAFRATMQNQATEDAEVSMDGFIEKMIGPFTEKLRTIEERVFGIVEGNHGWKFRDGTTIDSRMADLMKAPYSDGTLAVPISMGIKGNRTRLKFVAICHHGTSGAQTIGGDLNSVLKHAGYWGNIHVMFEGHTHKLGMLPDVRLIMSARDKVKHQLVWVGRCGGAVKGYGPGTAGYAERRQFPPTVPGHNQMSVWIERSQIGGKDVQHLCYDGRSVPLQGHSLQDALDD